MDVTPDEITRLGAIRDHKVFQFPKVQSASKRVGVRDAFHVGLAGRPKEHAMRWTFSD